MDEQEKKALQNIEEYGNHVISVMEGDGYPRFTYSIGINKTQFKPDIIILGLKPELAHSIANNYRDRLLSGEIIKPGKYYSDFIGNFDVVFEKVACKYYKDYFGWARWLHEGDDFEMLQLIWPTTNGVWPWDDDTSEYYNWAQPVLNESGVLDKI